MEPITSGKKFTDSRCIEEIVRANFLVPGAYSPGILATCARLPEDMLHLSFILRGYLMDAKVWRSQCEVSLDLSDSVGREVVFADYVRIFKRLEQVVRYHYPDWCFVNTDLICNRPLVWLGAHVAKNLGGNVPSNVDDVCKLMVHHGVGKPPATPLRVVIGLLEIYAIHLGKVKKLCASTDEQCRTPVLWLAQEIHTEFGGVRPRTFEDIEKLVDSHEFGKPPAVPLRMLISLCRIMVKGTSNVRRQLACNNLLVCVQRLSSLMNEALPTDIAGIPAVLQRLGLRDVETPMAQIVGILDVVIRKLTQISTRWNIDRVDVLYKQLVNYHARLVKFNVHVDFHLPSLPPREFDSNAGDVLPLVRTVVTTYNMLYPFVNQLMDFFHDKLGEDVRGNNRPVQLRALKTSSVTAETWQDICDDVNGRTFIFDGTLAAIEGAVIFEKRRNLNEELSAQEVLDQLANVGLVCSRLRDKVVAKGQFVPRLPSMEVPRFRMFGWVPQVIKLVADNWSTILSAIQLLNLVLPKVSKWVPQSLPTVDFRQDENSLTNDLRRALRAVQNIVEEMENVMEGRTEFIDRDLHDPTFAEIVPADTASHNVIELYGLPKGREGRSILLDVNFRLPELKAFFPAEVLEGRSLLSLETWKVFVNRELSNLLSYTNAAGIRINALQSSVLNLETAMQGGSSNAAGMLMDIQSCKNDCAALSKKVDEIRGEVETLKAGTSGKSDDVEPLITGRVRALETSVVELMRDVRNLKARVASDDFGEGDDTIARLESTCTRMADRIKVLESLDLALLKSDVTILQNRIDSLGGLSQNGSSSVAMIDSIKSEVEALKKRVTIVDGLDARLVSLESLNVPTWQGDIINLQKRLETLEKFGQTNNDGANIGIAELRTDIETIKVRIANMDKERESGFTDTLRSLEERVRQLETASAISNGSSNKSDGEIARVVANLGQRVANLEKSGGGELTMRVVALEARNVFTDGDRENLRDCGVRLNVVEKTLRNVITVVNGMNSGDPSYRPLDFKTGGSSTEGPSTRPISQGQAYYPDLCVDSNYNFGYTSSLADPWLDNLPLDGRDIVMRKKWYAELRNGCVSTVMQNWYLDLRRSFSEHETKQEDVEEEEWWDCEEDLEPPTWHDCQDFSLAQAIPEVIEESDQVLSVTVRTGRIPLRSELGQVLGYAVGRRRLWLTHAECWFFRNHEHAQIWLQFRHPSSEFTGPWDVHRQQFLQALRPISHGQNDGEQPPIPVQVSRDLEEANPNLSFIEHLTDPGQLHPNQRVIDSGKKTVPMALVPGSLIFRFPIADIYDGNGPFPAMFGVIGMVRGSMEIHLKCNLSPLCGTAFMVGYAEGGLQTNGAIDLFGAAAYPHYFWNPACEDSVFFSFKPISCMDEWHPSFLRKHPGAIFIAMVMPWAPAPKHMMGYTWRISYVPKVIPKQIVNVEGGFGQYVRAACMSVTFVTNASSNAKISPFNPGAPAMTTGIGYTLWESLLGMSQYWTGDMVFEVLKASSPMIAGTFGMALISGSKMEHVNGNYLQTVPHVEFTLGITESRKRVVFPSSLLGLHAPSERMALSPASGLASYTLVVWLLDTISGSDATHQYNMFILLEGIENLVLTGFNGGYPVSNFRLLSSHAPLKVVPAEETIVHSHLQDALRYQLPDALGGLADFIPPRSDTFGQFVSPAFHCLSWRPNATKSFGSDLSDFVLVDLFRMSLMTFKRASHATVVYSPFVRVLRSCCWLRGKLRFQLVWACKPGVKIADFNSSLRISVYNDEVYSLRIHHHVTASRCGEHVFEVEALGPFDGFFPQTYQVETKKYGPQLAIEVIGDQFDYYEMYVQPVDVQICGVASRVRADALPAVNTALFSPENPF